MRDHEAFVSCAFGRGCIIRSYVEVPRAERDDGIRNTATACQVEASQANIEGQSANDVGEEALLNVSRSLRYGGERDATRSRFKGASVSEAIVRVPCISCISCRRPARRHPMRPSQPLFGILWGMICIYRWPARSQFSSAGQMSSVFNRRQLRSGTGPSCISAPIARLVPGPCN